MSEEKSVQPILFMSMDDPMFEVHGPDGHVWMIRNSGITSGFPEGAMVINHVQSKLNMLIGLMLKNAHRSLTASAGGGDAPAAGQLFVIRCIPDPFTGEMFNIGVCATDMRGNRVAKVLTAPGRLECMYGEAAGHVVALAAVAKEAAESGGPAPSSQIVFDTPTDYYGGSAEEAAANAFADQVTVALPFNRCFSAAQQP